MTKFFKSLPLFLMTLAAKAAMAAPVPKEMTFQPAATPVMEHITEFHDMLLYIITGIVIFVLALLVYVMLRFNAKAHPEPSRTTHNVPLEIVWTLVPVLILLVIAIPSFRLLFFQGITPEADMTIKVTGNQWNWTYEYPEHGDINFTAYMVKDADLKPGQPRLLTSDNPIYLPLNKVVRIQITASDVIHSFAVPSFGIKTDAVPGRLSETWVKITKPGVYYGQCSELCGKDHGFMPIEVHAVSDQEFADWVVSKGGKMPAPKEAATDAKTDAAVPATTEDKIQSPEEEGHPEATPENAAPAKTDKE